MSDALSSSSPAAIPSAAPAAASRPPLVDRGKRLAFLLIASLFFSWALAASLNDVLIRHFQKALDISRSESALIQSAFYVGYFCAALPAGWIMRRFGYKAGILAGLGLYAAGALLFWPAADVRVFGIFLAALYIIACGLAFLETAANPYVAVMGDPRTGPSRLNLAQSFHGLGMIVGPVIGGLFILSGVEYSAAELAAMTPAQVEAYRAFEAESVQWPYVGVAAFALCLALLIGLSRLPTVTGEEADAHSGSVRAALRHRHLAYAVIAQFFYVGAQVAIWSYFIDFAKEILPATPERTVAFWLSGSLAMVLVGRLSGALIMSRVAPHRLLAGYAVANVVLCAAAMIAGGGVAVAALWLTSFFMSIMFPTIFALGVRGLGPATKIASSLLIMSIIGGALLPPLMGLVADSTGSLQPSLIVPLLCFLVVLWYGLRGYRDGTPASV